MSFRSVSLSKFCGFLFLFVVSALLNAQTTITVNNTAVQSTVQRLGINLGQQAFYDSGQIMKNLVFTNPSFEGEIYQSTIQCGSATANSCTDANVYSGFPVSFWNNASYMVISGNAVGRTGTVCGFSHTVPNWPYYGVFTFCDSGTAPAQGDYIVVKMTMPASLGWPGGDWQTVVGGGTLTPETNDLPPGTLGKQSALLTAATASDSIGVNFFFDTTKGKTFLQLNGSYQLTFKAKGVAGAKNVAVLLNRSAAGLTYINQTQPLTSAWQTYTINFNGTENGTATGNVELSFTAAGPDTVELDDVSLMKTGTDPTNTTVFRDEVVNALQALHPGVLRMWEDQLGESLDNMLAGPTAKQRSAYTPYNGYDGTDVNFQTQTLEFGLTDFLQLCQKVGADPWIVVPSTFSTGEAYSLAEYLAGSSSTTYGAKRAAAGQTAPWTSVFHQIHLEFGNEEWNGGTFKGGAIELAPAYGQAATNIFAAIKGNPAYTAASFDLIVDGQSTAPYNNQTIESYTTNNDSFSIAPYMMYNINDFDSVDHLFGTTFAEAEAFVTPTASAEGVSGGFITSEQTLVGKPIVTSEMNLSPSSGSMDQTTLNGYASSVGGGIAVIDAMMQQLRAGVRTQNLFELPGYVSGTNNGTTMYLWGSVVDMGVTNRLRPQYLALQLANSAIGSATTEVQTVHSGADPTDNQYDYALNTVTLPTFHFLQSFAFTSSSGAKSLLVFNVGPDAYDTEQVNFAGPNAPTGTVVMQQLTSGFITDTNEFSNVVATTSQTLTNFNPSANITLPAFSMTVFTWGGTSTAPAISAVQATSVSPTSETITWTTDQPSSSKVNYGATTSYGSSSTLNSTLVTSHSVTLTGLTANTPYDFDVVSVNGSSLSSTSSNATFTTAAVPPAISNVAVSGITTTGATITWTTDQSSSSSASYGTTTSYGSTGTGTGGVTSHSVALTGLTPGTTYDFDVTSTNAANASATSTNSTFATLTAPPVISNVLATAVTPTSETITWNTDQASTSVVNFGATTSYGSQLSSSTLVTSHSVTLTGLTQSTTYQFDVVSVNATSQSTPSANSNFLTLTPSPTISAVAVSNITATGATITWTTDLASSSQVYYGTTTSYNMQSTLNAALVTSHSVVLTGLTAATLYDLQVVSTNNPGGTTLSTNTSFTTLTNPPAISAILATGVSPTSETITWTTDEPSSSQVAYGTTTGYGALTTVNPALTTTHSVTITTGLAQSTNYDFAVISVNAASQSTTSTNNVFLTQTPAPTISAVTVSNLTTTGATITWTTDLASSSTVNYGTTTGYGSSTPGTGGVTSHSVTLSGLTPGTLYNFDVVSTNSPGGTSTSTNSSFTTVNVAPTITNVAFSNVTANSATITWTTNETSSSVVNYGLTTSYGSTTTGTGGLTAHSVTLTGLTSGTLYDFNVTSVNSSSQSTSSGNSSFTTTAVPPVISSVAVSGITTTGATITWTTDQSSSSVVNYGTTTSYGSSMAGTSGVTAHSVTLTGLTPGTTYDFDVTSANTGNGSASSTNSTFVTVSVPPTISAVSVTNITSIGATITWTTDQSSTSSVSYGTTTAYGSTATGIAGTSHTVNITGLTPGTTYDFDVTSLNTTTNMSATSTNSSFQTVAAPVISAVATSGITSVAATITWTTDQPSSSQVFYGTTTSYGSSSTLNSALVTVHSVTISGLIPGATYDFKVTSVNGSTASSSSANSTFVTTAAPVISAVATSGTTSIATTITWTTDQASSSQVNYGTSTAYGTSSTLNSSLVTNHSVTINGLTPGATYDFDVVSVNGSTASTTSANFTFATTPAPAITNIASTVTTTGATITWTTDQASSSSVAYGTTTAYGSTATGTGGTTSHSVTLTGLTAGTTYDFTVTSVNASTASSTSANTTLVTTPVAPVITNVVVSGSTTTTATINWTTDQPSTSQVFFGTTTGYGSSSTLNSTLTTAHSVTITGLSPATMYDFDVVSVNSFSLPATSPNSTFTTPQGTPPNVGYVAAWGISNNGAVVTWSTDVVATTQLAYGTTTSLGQLSTLDPTLAASHGVTLAGLIPGTQYYFMAQSTGANGATGYSTLMTFTTTGTAPAGPPVISNVVVTGITNTSATITWTTDQASSSKVNFGTTTGYGSVSTVDPTLVTSHTVTLTGLTLGTTYDFDVVSANAGAMSANSTNSTFLTTNVVYTPPVITNITTTNLTSTSVTVNWTTDQPASSQVNYGTNVSYGSSSPVTTTLVTAHSITLTGLAAGTAYDFDVVSANGASQSTTSGNGTFSTPATTATPPNVGYVVAWGINNSGAVVTWSTDVTASTQLAYGTTTALGQLSTLDPTLAASHGVTLSGLVSGTKYYFMAQSTGANGATGYSTMMSFTTTGTAPAGPPVISSVAVTNITNTSATITWTTDQASSSQVNFGTTTGYGSSSTLDTNLVTSHSVTLTGLTLGTTYDFDVTSANAGAMSATSGNSTFLTTNVVSTPPTITNLTTTNLTSTSVTVTWTTNQPANSQVNYGTTMSYGSSTTLDTNLVTAHSETVTGLAAGTAYNFDVVSANAASQPTTSPNATFSTPATTATPPNVGYVASWGISNTGAVVTWSTDVLANTQLAYGTSAALGQLSPLQTTLAASHGVTLSGLNPGTQYYFQAQSTAANGATGYSTVMTFTTTGTQTTPPPVISAVTVTNITNTSAKITWTTDEASSSLVNYGATTTYNLSSTPDPTLVTAHSVTLTGLTAGTLYDFDVVSANSLALSSTSTNASFTTTGTAPGPVISNISSSPVTSGTATISWTTDQASTSVVNFGTTTGYGTTSSSAALVTTHSVTLTGLTPNTMYAFDVASANSANTTTTSANFTFKTSSNTGPAPVISYLSFWGVTATQATVTWSTDVAANTAVAYGTTNALGQLSPVQTTLTSSHGVTLTGLAPGTTYYFVAQSADGSGNTGYSTTYSFTTIQGPPTISGVTANPQSGNKATISWTTSVATNSYVQFGTVAGNYGYYTAQTNLTTTPTCSLTYVPSGTIHYQMVSTDANGNQTLSPDMTFVEP